MYKVHQNESKAYEKLAKEVQKGGRSLGGAGGRREGWPYQGVRISRILGMNFVCRVHIPCEEGSPVYTVFFQH